jgi:hypothetical protein
MRSKEALLETTHPRWIQVAGMVRRMAISLTSKVLWQLVGFRLPYAQGGATAQEVLNAEPFTGIGFFARPPSSGAPEAIVVSVGDANAPMIIAVRDEKTRAAIAGALQAGETAMYTDQAIVYLRGDGTIEARTAGGAATALATKQDLQILRAAIGSAVIAIGAGGANAINLACDAAVAVLVPPVSPPTWPIGTRTLKGE